MREVAPDDAVAQPAGLGEAWWCDFSSIAVRDRRAWIISLAGRAFRTSGTSSGIGVDWLHDGSDLLKEAEMAAQVLTTAHAFDSVVTVAPPISLFGYSVGVLVPALLGLRCEYDRLGVGGLAVPDGMPLIVMLPPIPIWRRLECAHDRGRTFSVAHAGAGLPDRGVQLAAHGVTITEMFGATESGLVATRPAACAGGPERWTVVPDAHMRVEIDDWGVSQPLVMTSSRMGRPATGEPSSTVQLGDHVVPLDEWHFQFFGRRERIAKVGGAAVDLDRLEQQVSAALGVNDVACSGTIVKAFGDHVLARVVLDPGDARTAAEVRRDLRSHVGAGLDVLPLVAVVSQIERGPMGKTSGPRPASAPNPNTKVRGQHHDH